MKAITISRQIGSKGNEIAQLLSDTLGYQLAWRELINQAAKRSGSPEVALATIDDLGLLDICPSPKACRAYRISMEQVLKEIAQRGNVVILGKAGQVILSNTPAVFHVHLIAPARIRMKRIAQRQGISLECARAQILTSDRNRARYLRRFYRVKWDDPNLYDLILNTGRVKPIKATEIIHLAFITCSQPQQTKQFQEATLENTHAPS